MARPILILRRSASRRAGRAVAGNAIADELDIDVILVGRPVALEIVEEARPVGQQPVRFEIAQREGKAVVDAD